MDEREQYEEKLVEMATQLAKLRDTFDELRPQRLTVGLGAARPQRTPVTLAGLAGACAPCAQGEVEWLMLKSGRLALARACGVPFEPFPYMITTTFSAAGAATNPDVGPNRNTARDVIFHAIDVDVQDPNEFVGNVFKSERDYFFALSSGLQCTIKIDGVSRWSTPYFPLRALQYLISPSDPWILNAQQGIQMDFNTSTVLPAAGIVVNTTFLGVTPGSDNLVRMSQTEAFDRLDKMGYDTREGRSRLGC